MEFLKNFPTDPAQLAQLIEIRPGRVVSMSLSRSEHVSIMLMSVADDEEVTSEQYPGDLIYYVVEGEMPLERETGRTVMHAGEIAAIPANEPHSIGGGGAFKLLQMIITG